MLASPARTSGWPIRAPAWVTRTSQQRPICIPAPAAMPFHAATAGFERSRTD